MANDFAAPGKARKRSICASPAGAERLSSWTSSVFAPPARSNGVVSASISHGLRIAARLILLLTPKTGFGSGARQWSETICPANRLPENTGACQVGAGVKIEAAKFEARR